MQHIPDIMDHHSKIRQLISEWGHISRSLYGFFHVWTESQAAFSNTRKEGGTVKRPHLRSRRPGCPGLAQTG